MAATYPVSVNPKPYRGRDQSKQFAFQQDLKTARQIETYLNDRMKTEYTGQFDYYEIADALELPKDVIKKLLQPLDFGQNGITIVNNANKPDDK